MEVGPLKPDNRWKSSTQNDLGEWVPSIPEPFYGLRKQCWDCKPRRRFWTKAGYRGHYALVHILRTP
jgi:hypothetical protein